MLRGMWDLPGAGIKLVSTDLEVRFLIVERPRATTRDDHQGRQRATIFQAELMPENGALVISKLGHLGGFTKEEGRLEPKGYPRLN